MEKTINGKVYVLGDNVDTDQIIPAEYLKYDPTLADERALFGKYALCGVPEAQAGLPNGNVAFVDQADEKNTAFVIFHKEARPNPTGSKQELIRPSRRIPALPSKIGQAISR